MKYIYTLFLFFGVFSHLLFAQLPLQVEHLGTYNTGVFDEGAAEIVAFDPESGLVFFTNANANTVDIISAEDPSNPVFMGEIDLSPYGGGVNSVDFSHGYVAIAVEAEIKQDPGKVVLFDIKGNFLAEYQVGPLPDMLTFDRDGGRIVVANEGEPNDEYTVDPEGSISVIDIRGGLLSASVTHIDFNEFDDKKENLMQKGIRIFGPNASTSQDFEPEYITITPDNQYAFVALQENNAIAKIDLGSNRIEDVIPLGLKDHRFEGQGLDPSNSTENIEIANWPVFGMYQPDAMDAYTASDGRQYIVSANEGDSRDYDGFSEETRVKDLVLNTTNYPNADELQQDERIGRLKTTTASGDIDGDGTTDVIHIYGARSFSIWDTDGRLVWDSGDQIEQILAREDPLHFNSTNDDNDSYKNRNDDKGPEPEAIRAFELFGKDYVAVGLERMGGLVFFDVSDVQSPEYIDYINNRNFNVNAETPEAGDLGVEDIVFVPSHKSPNEKPMLITANEISGTISFFGVTPQECDAQSSVFAFGGATEINRCVGDVIVEMEFDIDVASHYWYIITDEQNNILAYSDRSNGDMVDLSAAPEGICRIWGWSHDGSTIPKAGSPASTLNIGCNQLSDNYVAVNRINDGSCSGAGACEQPTNFRVRDLGNNRYLIRWDRVDDVRGYSLRIIANGNPSSRLILLKSNAVTIGTTGENDIAIEVRTNCGINSTSLFSDIIQLNKVNNDKSLNIASEEITIEETNITDGTLYPNPVQQILNYTFSLIKDSSVEITISDFMGRRISNLYSGKLEKGNHNFKKDLSNIHSGIYFLNIKSGEFAGSIKFIKVDK